jgi:hypothetical protein
VEGTLSYNCMGRCPLDRHDGGNVNKAEPPPTVLLPRVGNKLGAPSRSHLCTAANRGPGYLERFPVGRPQVGKDYGLNRQYNCPLHWHQTAGTIEPGLNFMLKPFDMRSQSLFPPTSKFHTWKWFAAHDKVPQLQLKTHVIA